MYGILVSAFFSVITWGLRAGLAKAAVFGVMVFLVGVVLPALVAAVMPGGLGDMGLGAGFGALSDAIYWFLEYFQFPRGFTLVMAAYLARFTLKRMPFIG